MKIISQSKFILVGLLFAKSIAVAQVIMSDDGTLGFVNNVYNHPLWLGTNNTERMRIDTSGNVGIRQTNPAATVDVVGATTASAIAAKITTGAVATGQALVVSGGATATAASTVAITGSTAATGAALAVTSGANGGKAVLVNSTAAPTANIFEVQRNSVETFSVDKSGHLSATNTTITVPTVGSCTGGTGSLVAGSNDVRGKVLFNAGTTACVLTFGTAYTTAPTCVVTSNAVGSRACITTGPSTTAFTVSVQTAATDFFYFCIQ